MTDLSGMCSTHGIIVFRHDDAVASDTIYPGHEANKNLAPGMYWASHQHGVLTGKANGPFEHGTAALAHALIQLSAYCWHEVLENTDT